MPKGGGVVVSAPADGAPAQGGARPLSGATVDALSALSLPGAVLASAGGAHAVLVPERGGWRRVRAIPGPLLGALVSAGLVVAGPSSPRLRRWTLSRAGARRLISEAAPGRAPAEERCRR